MGSPSRPMPMPKPRPKPKPSASSVPPPPAAASDTLSSSKAMISAISGFGDIGIPTINGKCCGREGDVRRSCLVTMVGTKLMKRALFR